MCFGCQPVFLTASMYLAEVPKMVMPSASAIVEEHAFRGVEWRTVVEQQRGTRGEAGDQPVPHHPAAGGEIEEPVGGLCVGIQHMLAQMLEQDAAGAMNDAFGNARRAGRIEDVERVIEGHLREGDGPFVMTGEECLEAHRSRQRRGDGLGLSRIVDHHSLCRPTSVPSAHCRSCPPCGWSCRHSNRHRR